ncbi:MAG TPA: hypothetical protein VJ551_02170, partial [Nitrososphaeraceae archaeon]|nr:hypothetical protein [Nitrososphaeraceae archaeon]
GKTATLEIINKDRGNDNFVILFKRGSMKYGDLNRFGIVSAHINDMVILVSPRNYQIGKQQEIQHEH